MYNNRAARHFARVCEQCWAAAASRSRMRRQSAVANFWVSRLPPGREYPPAVLKAAVAKYEGIKCNVDHVDSDAGEKRSYRDRWARFAMCNSARAKGFSEI